MKNVLDGTRSTALNLVGDAAHGVRNGIGHAMNAISAGISLVGLRDTGRAVVKAARRNPATTAVAVTAAVGAGVALWVLLKSRLYGANGSTHKAEAPIEVEPIRVERKPARRTARKTAARKATARSTTTASRPTAH
jgi:hypothetical protein